MSNLRNDRHHHDHDVRSIVSMIVRLDGDTLLAECVQADGTSWPWLIRADGQQPGCCCAVCAPHEQLGAPWPSPRCGGTCKDGQPCKTQVARAGLRCHHHRERG